MSLKRQRYGRPFGDFGGGKPGVKKSFKPAELRAVELLAKLGATGKHIAAFFDVHESTVEGWHRNNKPFQKAYKRGSVEADLKVAQSLYRRATGFSFIEEEYTAIEVDGVKMPLEQMALVKRTKKRLPPDVKAAIHWLRIRQREIWTVVPEMLHLHTGNVNHLHRKLQDIPVQELSGDAQKLVFEIAQKQLATTNGS